MMRLVSSVTAPFRARALPHPMLARVFRPMLVSARMFPSKVVLVPRVGDLPEQGPTRPTLPVGHSSVGLAFLAPPGAATGRPNLRHLLQPAPPGALLGRLALPVVPALAPASSATSRSRRGRLGRGLG